MSARDRLFLAARDLFDREGVEGLSIREVARRAGMSAMAIYRHFPDKDALLDALMQDGFAAWEARALAIEAADPVDWLRRLLEAYRDFALEQPHRFDAAFLLPSRKARAYPHDMAAGRSPVVSRMVAEIERAQAVGRMRSEPPVEVALVLAALAQGLVSMHRAGRFGGEEQFRESYRAAVAHGLAGFLTGGERE